MDKYDILEQNILENIKCKTEETDYGYIKILAYYCENLREFELVCEFEGLGRTNENYCKRNVYHDEKFRGSDWYFFYDEDVALDGHYSEYHYYTETLTEKKEKFKLFCSEYEER